MDTSRYTTAAVLSQLCKDDKWHPVGFTSKILLVAERNYEIHDKSFYQLSEAWKSGGTSWKELKTQ